MSFNVNSVTKNMVNRMGVKIIGIDNGCYSRPEKYDDEKYLNYLTNLNLQHSLFATAPDVVGDYKKNKKKK